MRPARISKVFAARALARAAACAPSAPRAIRIRSPMNHNERPFQPGKYGEAILANSAD